MFIIVKHLEPRTGYGKELVFTFLGIVFAVVILEDLEYLEGKGRLPC